ncbi:Lsr2 family protein [Nocardioides sp. KC13]|uniref:Lsr2 family protein n=1 Tax=Nocardioides turkmenicus TaxID=2711220 RepID=A0A6M1QPL5_9ACTN|nr:Lsr2 family protein [Nocardioides sp. KC13]NGN91635.1 Lsr2 family protein [Nocardioides sp. KC13]
MAKKVQIILEDDIDGSEAAETVSFALDGTNYEIDLSEANAAKLRDSLALFIGHAQKITGRRGGGAKKAAASGGSTPKVMREWAKANGYTVPDRGRIPAEVREAFEAAH